MGETRQIRLWERSLLLEVLKRSDTPSIVGLYDPIGPLCKKGDPYYNPNLSVELTYRIKLTQSIVKRITGLEPPLATLLAVYCQRGDLQRAYPEALNGDYRRLINWASSWGIRNDSSRSTLLPYAEYYRQATKESIDRRKSP